MNWGRGMATRRLFSAVAFVVCVIMVLCPHTVLTEYMGVYAGTVSIVLTRHSLQKTYMLINVSDYPGETDYERIQKALNDSALAPEGAVVFIPEGTWEACDLKAFSNTIILGTNGTVLRRPQNMTLPFITFEDQAHFGILNMTFEGHNVTGGAGIQITNGTDFQIAGNLFLDIAQHALHIVGQCQDFSVESNVFLRTNVAPLLIFGFPGSREVTRFLVANNTLMMSDNNGKIGVAFASNGTIADNYLYNCTYGVGTRCVSDLLIKNNRMENCTDYGIYLGTQPGDIGSDNVDITENYISGSDVGIARYYGSGFMVNITVRNNMIINNIQSDIYADFQGSFLNNTLTSRDKTRLLTIPVQFAGNVDINMTLIIPADIQGDGRVNMWDVGTVARLFGIILNSANWNPRTDVIQDGVIDMKDVGYVARCFSP
jgi:hypothetical protein